MPLNFAPARKKRYDPCSSQGLFNEAITDAIGSHTLYGNDGQYSLRVERPSNSLQAVAIGLTVSGNFTMDVRLIPRQVIIARVEIVAHGPDRPNGTYLVGRSYRFRTRAFDPIGQEIAAPLVPQLAGRRRDRQDLS